MMTSSLGASRLAPFVLCAALALVACGSPGVHAIPDSAQGRISLLAERLPARSEASLYMSDLPAVGQGALEFLNTRAGERYGRLELFAQVEERFGVDVRDVGTLERVAGVAVEGGVALSVVDGHPVLLAFVNDPEAFDAFVSSEVGGRLSPDAEVVTLELGGVEVRRLAPTEGRRELAWTHFGKLVILAAHTLERHEDDRPAAEVVAGLVALERDASTGASEPFRRFLEALGGSHPITGFVDLAALRGSERFGDLVAEFGNDGFTQLIEAHGESMGFGVSMAERVASLELFVGSNDAFDELRDGVDTNVAPNPFGGFATTRLLAAARVSVDFGPAWVAFRRVAPQEVLAVVDEFLENLGSSLGLVVERDVFAALTGNMGVFVHEIDFARFVEAAMKSDPLRYSRAIELVIALEFESDEALATLESALADMLSEGMNRPFDFDPVEGVSGARALTMPMGLGSLVSHAGVLAYATGAWTPRRVAERIVGASGHDALETSLGGRLTSQAPFGGVYFSASKFAGMFGPMLAMNPRVEALSEAVEELSVRFEGHEGGVSVVSEVVLKDAVDPLQ